IAERVFSDWLEAQAQLNRARLSIFSGAGVASVPQGPFERQAQFDALLNDALPALLELDSYQKTYERWLKESEPAPLPERPVPEDWVLWKDEGVALAPGAAAAFLELAGDVELAYADEDWLSADGKRHRPFFKPAWSLELALERDLLGGAVWVRRS